MKNITSCTFFALLLLFVEGFSQSPAPAAKEFKTKTGKVITVAETHPTGASLSNLRVAFKGNSGSAVQFTDVDPVNRVLVADLDGDGFSEIYIITLSAGTGSYGNVIGLASLRDKSLSMITFPEVGEGDLKKGAKFEGYEGHDLYEINQNTLVRTFPVKAPKPAKHVVKYRLKAGEASLKLVITD